jgi:hypothetical protein
MPAKKVKKEIKNFNRYSVNFDFYYITSFTKKKSILKLQLLSTEKTPDESVNYVYGIVSEAYKSAFNKKDFSKNVIRFGEFRFITDLIGELAQKNLGLTKEDQVKSLASLLKQHLLM